jgi:hypothetical protein
LKNTAKKMKGHIKDWWGEMLSKYMADKGFLLRTHKEILEFENFKNK